MYVTSPGGYILGETSLGAGQMTINLSKKMYVRSLGAGQMTINPSKKMYVRSLGASQMTINMDNLWFSFGLFFCLDNLLGSRQ